MGKRKGLIDVLSPILQKLWDGISNSHFEARKLVFREDN
jgi:hypothetical protein